MRCLSSALPGCILLALAAACLSGCHESELEPRTPDQVWDLERPGASAEAAYTMAPVPAVINPAPTPRERPQSRSLGYVGDEPLAPLPSAGPHWPYVPEPFHYREPYPSRGNGYGRGRGHWVRVPRAGAVSAYATPTH